jgi:RNA polymerase sigma-70 factor (ECF subfamily)
MNEPKTSVNDLAKACAHSAAAAEWDEFVHRCVPLAAMVAARVARMWLGEAPPAVVDDIVQEVFLKLCEQERRILRDFEPRGEESFLGLLRIVAASVANDHFRRQSSVKRGGRVTTSALLEEEAPMPADGAHQAAQMQRAALMAQLDSMMRSAPEVIPNRDRLLFWLYYRQGFTAEEIARLSGAGLSAKGVESALRRVTMWLRGEVGQETFAVRPDRG